MEKIEKDYGYIVKDETGNIYDYAGGHTDEGIVYKDYSAFEQGVGVCYISENELNEMAEELEDLKYYRENSNMDEEAYLNERRNILSQHGETRKSIIDQVMDAFATQYMLTEKQVEYTAGYIFSMADWAYILTYLMENFAIEDLIESDHDKPENERVFTDTQYDAVMAGVYPAEYNVN